MAEEEKKEDEFLTTEAEHIVIEWRTLNDAYRVEMKSQTVDIHTLKEVVKEMIKEMKELGG